MLNKDGVILVNINSSVCQPPANKLEQEEDQQNKQNNSDCELFSSSFRVEVQVNSSVNQQTIYAGCKLFTGQ